MKEEVHLSHFKTKYADYNDVTVVRAQYGNGRTALQVLDEYRRPIVTASVNVVAHHVDEGFFHIKNWSENEGVLEELVKQHVVVDTGRRDQSHYVDAAVCKLGPVWFE